MTTANAPATTAAADTVDEDALWHAVDEASPALLRDLTVDTSTAHRN